VSEVVAQPASEQDARARVSARIAAAMRSETTLARTALGVIALHILDDGILQPQPGTSAGDHLAGALVPAGLLLLAAWWHPRLRAGARATVSLLFGFLGLVTSIEALYYTHAASPSGDDYTGLLALPSGLVLVGVGAVTLWRSRRTDDVRWWRYLRRMLLAAGALVVALVVLFPLSIAYVVTHTARAVVPVPRLGAPHEEVSFVTSDGLRLEGWYVPSRNRAAVIAFPGRTSSQKQTRMLVRHGYGVLLFDRRGEGESDGDPNAFGWAGERDVRGAVAFLQRRPDVDRGRIGGIGLSVGGEMMLEAAAESDGLRAVVSEGAGARSIREDRLLDGAWMQMPTSAVITGATALFANTMPPASLEDLVPRIAPRAVFFVYGEKGQSTEDELNSTYYAAAGEPKAIWEVPEAGHIGGITARPRLYERQVVAFFDRALLARTSPADTP
jgi:uncharacterized protein